MKIKTTTVLCHVKCVEEDEEGNVIGEYQTDPKNPKVLYWPFDLKGHIGDVECELVKAMAEGRGLTPKG